MFKILGGTPKSGRSLCLSCANMARRIGQNLQDQIFCSSYNFETGNGSSIVPFRVSECTEYRPFNQASIKDMNDIAWIIEPRKKGPAGFVDGAIKKEGEEEDESQMEIVITPPSKTRRRENVFED